LKIFAPNTLTSRTHVYLLVFKRFLKSKVYFLDLAYLDSFPTGTIMQKHVFKREELYHIGMGKAISPTG